MTELEKAKVLELYDAQKLFDETLEKQATFLKNVKDLKLADKLYGKTLIDAFDKITNLLSQLSSMTIDDPLLNKVYNISYEKLAAESELVNLTKQSLNGSDASSNATTYSVNGNYSNTKSAISSLSGDDKIAFKLIINNINEFVDPSSIRVISGSVSQNKNMAYLLINAPTQYGGRINESYQITSNRIQSAKSMFLGAACNKLSRLNELNVNLLNKAIKEYWDNNF